MPPLEKLMHHIASPSCAVCHDDNVTSSKYGAPNCTGCSVFFRRTVVHGLKYKCWRNKECQIEKKTRCSCRFCRLQKCFKVGMKAEAIQRRDVLGPRNPIASLIRVETQILGPSVNLQNHQYQPSQVHRRATARDICAMFKVSFIQASKWSDRFGPFRRLSIDSKKSVLAEYGIAFMLIQQGFKTAREAGNGYWLLQNGSFLNVDWFLELPEEHQQEIRQDDEEQAEIHEVFVTDLLNSISDPFKNLEIDEMECAALKSLLLLNPTSAIFFDQEATVASIHKKCLEELMDHCNTKPDGAQRFGEILLLISSIRCGVKTVYNHTRVSELFNYRNLDPFVKDVMLF